MQLFLSFVKIGIHSLYMHYFEDDGREDEVVGPSPSVHGGTRVKEKMQKLFNNSPSPRNIFKKSKD